jgi:tetratricopeptide (TPR) repeat protein
MKTWIQLLVAAVVAALVGFGSALLGTPQRGARGASEEVDVAALEAALRELKGEQAQLAQRLAELPTEPAAAGAQRLPAQDLDAAIAQFMARQNASPPSATTPEDSAVSESAALAEQILSGTLAGDALEALWQKLRDEKKIDGVLAEIERAAAQAPNNPDLQNELGKAYIQKLFDAGIGPLAATYGEKADQAFDRALALDDHHWEARFEKALALSNWPTFLGKQSEAMRQFEVLMKQQEERGVAAGSRGAETYLFLGNLYAQNGEAERAREVWGRGLQRFPSHAALRERNEERGQ